MQHVREGMAVSPRGSSCFVASAGASSCGEHTIGVDGCLSLTDLVIGTAAQPQAPHIFIGSCSGLVLCHSPRLLPLWWWLQMMK